MKKNSKNILVIDDEEMIRELLKDTFEKEKYNVETAEDGKQAFKMIQSNDYNLVITDIRLPDISGMEILEKIKVQHPDMGVIMITAYGSIKSAVKAMKDGAFDYIAKPFEIDEINIVVEKYFEFENLKVENKYLRSELDKKFNFKNIIGHSLPMQGVFKTIEMVAKSRATILIEGPSGTGKELIARSIHYNSDRKNGPFITINCASLPESLVESELFGHEKGAFTGAYKTNKGRFEMADGGSLLLDEISEISLGLQAKLLRVLQEKEIERVGGGEVIPVDVRIIATTNKDIRKEVKEKKFREDLFYRLNVVPIKVPRITERRDDIPILINHFIKLYCQENNYPLKKISEKAMKILINRDWPGNVREIENCVERAVVLSGPKCKELELKHFSLQDQYIHDETSDFSKDMTLREIEKEMILRKLKMKDGNRTETAENLGISVRTLRNKLNEYRKEGIDV
ncbi:MAG: sigma-54 dependent transcriptional regulator [bacterium]